MTKSLLIFDIDNTLVVNHRVYDEAYRVTSKEILGREFVMSRNPDGSRDTTFSKMSNPEIFRRRLIQLGIDPTLINEEEFFRKFDENASKLAEITEPFLLPGVVRFITEVSMGRKLVILTSGPRALQIAVLGRIDLLEVFDITHSLFFGDYTSREEGIEKIWVSTSRLPIVAQFSDSPLDMEAIREAKIEAKKIGIGVSVAGLTTVEELKQAGAFFVVENYDHKTLKEISEII